MLTSLCRGRGPDWGNCRRTLSASARSHRKPSGVLTSGPAGRRANFGPLDRDSEARADEDDRPRGRHTTVPGIGRCAVGSAAWSAIDKVLMLSSARIFARDIALAGSASQAMLTKATRRLAAAIQAGDHFSVHIDHLAAGVDPQAGTGVVNDRGRPCGVKRRFGDFIERRGLAEVIILPRLDEGIVSRHGVLQAL